MLSQLKKKDEEEHNIIICHCFFVRCISLSIWFLDLSYIIYRLGTKWIIPRFYTFFSSLQYLWSQVELLFPDITEHHFSWLEKSISLPAKLPVNFCWYPNLPSFHLSMGTVLKGRRENVNNNRALSTVLTNKTFPPPFHVSKETGSPVKGRLWVGYKSFPIALLFLC